MNLYQEIIRVLERHESRCCDSPEDRVVLGRALTAAVSNTESRHWERVPKKRVDDEFGMDCRFCGCPNYSCGCDS